MHKGDSAIFGYVTPIKSELRFREYDYYKMYYCGVCRSIGQHYGQLPRFGLTNETALLALILDVVCSTNNNIKTIKKGCIAHPHKKTLSIINNNSVDYAAAVNVILIYNKLKDNWIDDRNVLAQSGTLILNKAYKKAKSKHNELTINIEKHLNNLLELEKEKCASIDRVADPFALIMKDIFTKYPNIEENKFAHIGKLGYNIGKWIYLIDALNDIKEDIHKKRYNCLLYKFEYNNNEDPDSFLKRITDDLKFLLEMCLATITEAWEELRKYMNDSLETENAIYFIENVFYLGMRQKSNVILGVKDKGDENFGESI